MKYQKVSVLMTCYNAAKYIKFSIKSILSQTYKNWELIIIDDFSKDDSVKIIKQFKNKKIKLFTLKKHIGRTNALNYGLKKIKGQFIAILDADDVSLKDRLKTQIMFIKKNSDIKLVGTWFELINKKGEILKIVKSSTNLKTIKKKMQYKNIIGHSTIMFRKEILQKIKNYPKNFIYMQDYAFILKVLKEYKVGVIPKVLVKARVIKSSMTYSMPKKQIIKEKLELLNNSIIFKQDFTTKLFCFFEIIKARIKYLFV